MSTPIKFKKPSRFDAIRADKGVDHALIHPASGHHYGTIKTSLYDENSKHTQLAIQRYKREHSGDKEASGKYSGLYAFVMMCVHDWSGVFDEDGNEVPFSKEAAFQYITQDFEEDSWLAAELLSRSKNDEYYQAVGDPRASKKAAAGN